MTTVLERAEQLRSDPSVMDGFAATLGALAFMPVESTITGEQLAKLLAAMTYNADKQSEVTVAKEGRVYHATIDDSVAIKEQIGG